MEIERQSIFLYLLEKYEEGDFFEKRRREAKSVKSLRPYPDRSVIYLEPQRNRKQLGEFRQEIFSKQLQCFILGDEKLLALFDAEVSLDFKGAYKLSSSQQMQEMKWKYGDLVVIVIHESENQWYARQYEVFNQL